MRFALDPPIVLEVVRLKRRVPAGLRFLDTPGIGSLSQSGPAQAFAWLPRCDLGVVLVAAGNPVGTDDLALLTGLTRAGITARVLLSKSDVSWWSPNWDRRDWRQVEQQVEQMDSRRSAWCA